MNAALAADVLLLLVDHTKFKEINPIDFKNKALVDTRGIWR